MSKKSVVFHSRNCELVYVILIRSSLIVEDNELGHAETTVRSVYKPCPETKIKDLTILNSSMSTIFIYFWYLFGFLIKIHQIFLFFFLESRITLFNKIVPNASAKCLRYTQSGPRSLDCVNSVFPTLRKSVRIKMF